MNTLKISLISLLLFLYIYPAYAQNGKVQLAIDSLNKSLANQILLIYSENDTVKYLTIKNNYENISFKGRILISKNAEYLIFISYSQSVGNSKYYLFDVEKHIFYSSDWIKEYQIPLIFSFDNISMTMNICSFDSKNCGEFSKLFFCIEKMQNCDISYLERIKILFSVNL